MAVDKEKKKGRGPRGRRWWMWRIGVFGFVALFLAFLAVPGALLARQVSHMRHTARLLEAGNKQHSFPAIRSGVRQLDQETQKALTWMRWMGYLSFVPGIGRQYHDGEQAFRAVDQGLRGMNVLMPALKRIAPLLGYRGGAGPQHLVTGKQKISAVVSALPILGPDLRRAYPDFVRANQALDSVRPSDFRGFLQPLASKVLTAQTVLNTAVKNMPLIYQSTAALQNILGDPTPKRYLLIFQNSGELRATGGFMTAYAYVTVDRGKLSHVSAENMYLLDARVTYHPPASTVIATYLPVTYWHLRDANTSPNVPTTVAYIKKFYASIPNAPHIDGIIFLDTWFADELIGDVGSVTVPTSAGPVKLTAQNANLEMEYMAERRNLPNSERKQFIGRAMKALFKDVLHAHGTELVRILKTVDQGLNRKFILLSFNNPRAEAMAERYHWAGTMDKTVPGDYLSVVDENLLGHKDNFEMFYHIATHIVRVDGRWQETSSITYIDPAIDNGWLFVPYHSWVRFYVPWGSRLISITGVDGIPPETYGNATVHKTVFGGHVDLPPRTSTDQPIATHTVTVTYWLPKGIHMGSLTVQLQPGVNHQTFTVRDGGLAKTMTFTRDLFIKLPAQ